jgi:hypothetical protein
MDPLSRIQSETPQNRRTLRGGHDPQMGKATQFPAGISGNPGGRPKHTIGTIYRKWLKKNANRKKVENFINDTIEGDSRMAGVLLIREMDEEKNIHRMELSGEITVSIAETITAARKRASLEVVDAA